jgi:hypothetical protein
MMEQHRGFWISGSAMAGPPYTLYWESLGTVLKSSRLGSLIEVVRFQVGRTGRCCLTGITFSKAIHGSGFSPALQK